MIISPAESRTLLAAPKNRRAAAGGIAAAISLALSVAAVTVGSTSNSAASFLLFTLSLPWTISIYVLTMIFNVTSPIAVAITFVLMTFLMWRFVNRLLVRTVC